MFVLKLNAFLMVIPNMHVVIKFQHSNKMLNIFEIVHVSSAHACRMVSVQMEEIGIENEH